MTSNYSTSPIGIGFLNYINSTRISISIDKPLVVLSIQHAIPLLEMHVDPRQPYRQIPGTKNLFNMDFQSFTGGMGLVRDNLLQIFKLSQQEGGFRLRRLIVDLEAPVFEPLIDVIPPEIHKQLNSAQNECISKILSSNDYTLLLGMPGTGKTSTIVQTIRTLLSMGRTILLTSYTHSAVDNVLLKLLDYDLDFLRLGSSTKVNFEIN